MTMKAWSQKGLITGERMESSEPNKFIMVPARSRKKPVKMYAPVKMMSAAQYERAKKREAK